MTVTPEVQLDSKMLSEYIFIDLKGNEEDGITIMCNHCTVGSATFFDGDNCDTPTTDWIAVATLHILDKHKGSK